MDNNSKTISCILCGEVHKLMPGLLKEKIIIIIGDEYLLRRKKDF